VHRRRLSPRRLDDLIEQAIVDAYGPDEQAVGFHATLEQELALPFDSTVLGVKVSVRKLDVTDHGEVVAVCFRAREDRQFRSLTFHFPSPHRPGGNGSKPIAGGRGARDDDPLAGRSARRSHCARH
jgi:hypothetical protein